MDTHTQARILISLAPKESTPNTIILDFQATTPPGDTFISYGQLRCPPHIYWFFRSMLCSGITVLPNVNFIRADVAINANTNTDTPPGDPK